MMASTIFAQPPQAFKYQSVVRDNTGETLTNQLVSFRLSIHDSEATGTILYQETHSVTTNQFGLVNLEIGNGMPLIGTFPGIDWSTNDKFLEIELDPAGGTSYVALGTSQLLSVPYALYSDYTAHDLRNTLDEAYDEGGPGSGRFITADTGPVMFTVPATATNSAIDAANINFNDASSTILATTWGIGSAFEGHIINPANTSNAIVGITAGTGDGVYGLSGPAIPAGFGNVKIAGIAGESNVQCGVAGYSQFKDGVLGGTRQTGTFGDDADPYTITGGVHGEPAHPIENDGDNFSVVGTQSLGYSSTGVLGIGGQKGHGVIGIPGGHPVVTTAGVRGITREPDDDWPPANFPLKPLFNKEQVGVLGQAKDYVAVWGESLDKIGMVGSSGNKLSFIDLPPVLAGVYGTASQNNGIGVLGIASDGVGVHGKSNDGIALLGESDNATGVEGKSTGTLQTNAGVHAIGNGVAAAGVPNAAALAIENGAIYVDGEHRPAGTFTITGSWTQVYSCYDGDPSHDHGIANYVNVVLSNDLIVDDPDGSIILLTVESQSSYYQTLFAQVYSKLNGSAQIRISSIGCSPPFGAVKVHYLIINPAPQGS